MKSPELHWIFLQKKWLISVQTTGNKKANSVICRRRIWDSPRCLMLLSFDGVEMLLLLQPVTYNRLIEMLDVKFDSFIPSNDQKQQNIRMLYHNIWCETQLANVNTPHKSTETFRETGCCHRVIKLSEIIAF